MIWLLLVPHFWFTYRRLLQLHRFFQQEEYHSSRFMRWWWSARAFDRKGSLSVLLQLVSPLLGAAALSLLADPDARKEGKLPLRMTSRARRLFGMAAALYCLLAAGLFAVFGIPGQLVSIQLMPVLFPLAAFLLRSDEKQRQNVLEQEAKRVLERVAPFIIGITGSYGKSSTKHAVGHLLRVALGPTFWPEKGINTLMGTTRAIREELRVGAQYAVIEMGAYGVGSIRRLCQLTPPRAAIVTAVGPCHLERFGSLEVTAKAKEELPEALPADGLLVLNGEDPRVRKMARPGSFFYGFDSSFDCYASELRVTERGTAFVLHWKGQDYPVTAPVFGRHQVSNLLAAFTLAAALGGNPELLAGALEQVPPLTNRLEVRSSGGTTWLRDAYNSNPSGFSEALRVMQALPAERRILMTPGMIELGPKQEAENQRLAQEAADTCDRVFVVGDTNRDALLQGLRDGGLREDQIQVCDTRDQALALLQKETKEGDAVLIENDLPDLYERVVRF